MGWRRLVHRIIRKDMSRTVVFTRDDDLCIAFITHSDGETMRHACFTRGNKAVDQIDGSHEAVTSRILLWIEEFS